VPTATLLPLGPFPALLAAARAAPPGAVALQDGPAGGPDAWVLAAALLASEPDRVVLVILDPGRRAPGLLALMVATLDGLAPGRLAVAVGDGPTRDEVHGVLTALLGGATALAGARLGIVPESRPAILRRRNDAVWAEGDVVWQVG
jgi:hypothetical protein